jgi:hypothetical protein
MLYLRKHSGGVCAPESCPGLRTGPRKTPNCLACSSRQARQPNQGHGGILALPPGASCWKVVHAARANLKSGPSATQSLDWRIDTPQYN